jgi:hypothetical protein
MRPRTCCSSMSRRKRVQRNGCSSDRPEILANLWLPEGRPIKRQRCRRNGSMSERLVGSPEIGAVTAFVGEGIPRFFWYYESEGTPALRHGSERDRSRGIGRPPRGNGCANKRWRPRRGSGEAAGKADQRIRRPNAKAGPVEALNRREFRRSLEAPRLLRASDVDKALGTMLGLRWGLIYHLMPGVRCWTWR